MTEQCTILLENIEMLLLSIVEQFQGSEKSDPILLSDLKQAILDFTSTLSDALQTSKPPLSNREWEICRMIRSGLTTKEISSSLNITPKSVQNHRNNIRKKLNILNKNVNLKQYLKNL